VIVTLLLTIISSELLDYCRAIPIHVKPDDQYRTQERGNKVRRIISWHGLECSMPSRAYSRQLT